MFGAEYTVYRACDHVSKPLGFMCIGLFINILTTLLLHVIGLVNSIQ